MLGQIQTLWALLHNALRRAARRAPPRPREAFETARRITRHVYRDARSSTTCSATWLLPRPARALRPRRAAARLRPRRSRRCRAVFMAGVARIGHGLVREIYALNDRRPFEGLRSLIRHTSTGRPADMPLTEDWLLDFGLLLRHRRREGAAGAGASGPMSPGRSRSAAGSASTRRRPSDGLVLRDLVACTRAASRRWRMPSVRTLVARIEAAAPGLLEGCFAQDENRWTSAGSPTGWPTWTIAAGRSASALADDPPLTLFLMLEAEADAGGRSLGALGSILWPRRWSAALPDPASDGRPRAGAGGRLPAAPSRTGWPTSSRFLQRHYQLPDGARLHAAETPTRRPQPSQTKPNPRRRPCSTTRPHPPTPPPASSRSPTTSNSAGWSPTGPATQTAGPTTSPSCAPSSTGSPGCRTTSRTVEVRRGHGRRPGHPPAREGA